jgi:hypothetical protein
MMMSRFFQRSPWLSIKLWGASAGLLALVWPAIAHAQTPLIPECNELAEVVNRNQAIFETFEADIETFSNDLSGAETLDEIRTAASRYVDAVEVVTNDLTTFATDLDQLTFSDDALATYRDEYVGIVVGFEDALSIVAAAMDNVAESTSETELADNLEAVQTNTVEAISSIDGLAVNESNVIDGLNAYCGVEDSE